MALAACDRPTSNADLSCGLDKYWQINKYEFITDADGYFTHETEVDIKVITYDNYAKVTVDNITTTFEKVQEEKQRGEFGKIALTYKGNFPGSERTALLNVWGDIAEEQILQYNIVFPNMKAGEYSVAHSCYPVKEEYRGGSWSAAVPFHHHYKMPNKIEKCIIQIVDKLACNNEKCDELVIVNSKSKTLSKEEALALSKNWDYSNMKLYQNDGKLEEYEKDACDVLDRLNKFIHNNDLDGHRYNNIVKAQENCGDDCSKVIAEGKQGDFLIKVPATPEILEIANGEKTVKFLSVQNPQNYVQDGYCLVNTIPYNTMKQMGKTDNHCHFRLYCGSADSMNYNENYAVEVCAN